MKVAAWVGCLLLSSCGGEVSTVPPEPAAVASEPARPAPDPMSVSSPFDVWLEMESAPGEPRASIRIGEHFFDQVVDDRPVRHDPVLARTETPTEWLAVVTLSGGTLFTARFTRRADGTWDSHEGGIAHHATLSARAAELDALVATAPSAETTMAAACGRARACCTASSGMLGRPCVYERDVATPWESVSGCEGFVRGTRMLLENRGTPVPPECAEP